VSVACAEPLYWHSRILATNYPGGSRTAQEAQHAVISSRNAAVFARVRHDLLTVSARHARRIISTTEISACFAPFSSAFPVAPKN